ILAQDLSCLHLVAAPGGGKKTLERRRELQHCLQSFFLLELRGDIQRREGVTYRPHVDVIAARSFLGVVTAAGTKVEQLRIPVQYRAHLVGESERGRQEDVRRCSAVQQIARQIESAGAAFLGE